MTDSRLDSILAKYRVVADRRKTAAEKEAQRQAELAHRKHELLVKWDAVRNGLKKGAFELNKVLAAHGIKIGYEEQEPTHDSPHRSRVSYLEPFEYRVRGHALAVISNEHGELTVGITAPAGAIKRSQMNIVDFDEAAQMEWLVEFLDRTADPDRDLE